jgi:hypothetical protein
VKIVVGKAASVEFAVRRTAGKAATAHRAHAMAAEAAVGMAATQTTTAKAAAAVTAAASHAAATAAAKSAPTATPAAAAARKSIAGNGRACQRERGHQGDNLMHTRILHCGTAFPFDALDRSAPRLTAAKRQVRQVLTAI